MFLLPQELKFLIYLKVVLYKVICFLFSEVKRNYNILYWCLQAAKISLTELVFNENKVPNLQSHLVSVFSQLVSCFNTVCQMCLVVITQVVGQENIVGENYFLNQSAKEAYRSYILAYDSHSMKDIFDVHNLNLKVHCLLNFFLKDFWFPCA